MGVKDTTLQLLSYRRKRRQATIAISMPNVLTSYFHNFQQFRRSQLRYAIPHRIGKEEDLSKYSYFVKDRVEASLISPNIKFKVSRLLTSNLHLLPSYIHKTSFSNSLALHLGEQWGKKIVLIWKQVHNLKQKKKVGGKLSYLKSSVSGGLIEGPASYCRSSM